MNKYRAIRTTVDGIAFHSKREAARYLELKLLERAGEISDLVLQPRYPLMAPLTTGTIAGALRGKDYPVIGHYVADFAYYDERIGERVIEDVKGMKTAMYRWKAKHLAAQYGVKILET